MNSLDLPVLFEDEDILLVNKPAGVVVNRAKTVKNPTVQDWFAKHHYQEVEGDQAGFGWEEMVPSAFNNQFGTPIEIYKRRLGLAHRLDKDTSGVLLLAKNPGSLVNLLTQFKDRQINKKYWSLVHGQPRVDSAVINAPLARSPVDRHQFRVDIHGKKAVTFYQVLKKFDQLNFSLLEERMTNQKKLRRLKAQWSSYQQGFSLVECFPKTGRTHQIRVHMRHIGNPLVADEVYGGSQRSKLDAIWCPRHFLHARWIEFQHPRTGKKVHASAPLANDLQAVINLMMN